MRVMATDNLHIVVGLGATGCSCARFLRARQVPFAVVDSRETPPNLAEFQRNFADVPLALGPLDASVLKRASRLIVSPGVALTEPAIAEAIAAGVDVCGDIDLLREVTQDKTLVAITGSNGKSTVTTLVADMLDKAGWPAAVGGNLGTPALDLWLQQDAPIYVLELSSFQLERCGQLNADVAVVLNVSPDHMDRYANLGQYHQAKHRVFRGCRSVVINRDDALTAPLMGNDAKALSFGLGQPDLGQYGLLEQDGGFFLGRGREPLLAVSEMAMRGQHNVANALTALAIGELIDLPREAMLTSLRSYTGLAHRCQTVATIDGVCYIDDSKATNVGATYAAVEGLLAADQQQLILIAGGDGKGADFQPLRQVLQGRLKHLVVLGQDGPQMASELAGLAPVSRVSSLQDAVAQAQRVAQAEDLVLLSPACASLDMFASFMERGRQFAAAVHALPATNEQVAR